jgi:hypothetical protein
MERWDSESFGKLAKPSHVFEAAWMWLRGWRKMYYGVWWRKPCCGEFGVHCPDCPDQYPPPFQDSPEKKT